MTIQKEVRLPDIGDFKDVEVIELLVAEGDRVGVEDSLLTLESDKASMEIPAPYAGTISALKIAVGERINIGDVIALMEVDEDDAEDAPEDTQIAEAQAPAKAEPAPEAQPMREAEPLPAGQPPERPAPVPPAPAGSGGKPHASPSVRRFARELGVDLSLVGGSGLKGRITRDDVQQFVKSTLSGGAAPAAGGGGDMRLPSAPQIDFSQFGEIDVQPLGRIKKLSGAHLHRSWISVPHVTQFDEADITDLEAFRKAQKEAAARQDIRLTFMPFLMKAVASAMAAMPEFNSSLSPDGESLIYKRYLNIGVAVDTPNGLVVPVIKDVDKKGVFELAGDLMTISQKARDGKLSPGDMQGGCFTISSLGGIGGTQFTPIVNAPEVAILGVSRSSMKPVWNGAEFAPRMILPLALSYDHRVIDGAQGVRFTTYLTGLLSDIRRLLL